MNVHGRLAWNLRALRVPRGLSQEALAAEGGLDRAYVGRLERGLENPTVKVLERLAKALKIDVAQLLAKPPAGAAKPKPLRGGRKKATQPKGASTLS